MTTYRHPASADVSLRLPAEPKQDRSRRTRARILEAAEKLLQDRDFAELTMSDLAAAAGCGVGTLYGHIPGKDTLLACLNERHGQFAQSKAAKIHQDWAGADLKTRARRLCELAVDVSYAQRGVIRAVTQHLFSREGREVHKLRRELTSSFIRAASFLAEEDDPAAPRLDQDACEFGLLAVVTLAQQRIVFGDVAGVQIRYSRKELKERLTTLLLAYLQAESPAPHD